MTRLFRDGRGLRSVVGALCLAVASGMKGSDVLTVDDFVFGRWDEFGFLAGGSASVSANLATPAATISPDDFVWLLACTSDQFDNILDIDQNLLCDSRANLTLLCDEAIAMGNGNSTGQPYPYGSHTTWTWNKVMPEAITYEFLAVSCSAVPMDFDLTWHWANPGGEELSSGQIPLKAASTAFGWLWGILLGFLLLSMVYAKSRYDVTNGPVSPADIATLEPAVLTPIRSLHWLLLFLCIMWVVSTQMIHNYWQGASVDGAFSTSLLGANLSTSAISSITLILAILLISRGWQITRLSIYGDEKRHVFFCLILYLGVWIGWRLLPGFAFLFGLLVVYILILRYVFASVTWRLRLLQSFREYVGGGGGGAAAPPAPLGGATQQRIVVDGVVYVFNEAGDLIPVGLVGSVEVAALDAGAGQEQVVVNVPPPASTPTQPAAPTTPAAARPEDEDEGMSLTHAGSRVRAVGGNGCWNRCRNRTTGLIGDPARVPEGALTNRQIALLSVFRNVILLYLTADIMVELWSMLTLSGSPWTTFVIDNLINLGMGAYMVWVFRPRSKAAASPLYDPRGYGSAPLEETLLGSDGGATPRPVGADSPRPPTETFVSHGAGGAHLLVPED